MVATTKPTYGNNTGATILVNGNHVQVADADIASVAGSGNSAHFGSNYNGYLLGQHMAFLKGQTYVVSPALKTALTSASAPCSFI